MADALVDAEGSGGLLADAAGATLARVTGTVSLGAGGGTGCGGVSGGG